MENIARLVSRKPPEGLASWPPVQDALEIHGLVYEAVWIEDYGVEQLLDAWAKPRKIKAVEVRCSCCGEARTLPWTKTDNHRGGYGFLHPGNDEPIGSGEETLCPMCEVPVKVKKAAEIGRGWFLADETGAMSAAVVGKKKYLALTGWTVQRRIYRNAREELKIIPAEAYVFSPVGCAQLMGWRKSYSGTCGYFVSYGSDWRKPKDWSEHWGAADGIFGLTPALVARSCLPHCKLDVYLSSFQAARRKFPVAWLRLYQTHPNVENLLLSGLPMVLDDLLAEQCGGDTWTRNSRRGVPVLDGIDWKEVRPDRMLGLDKDELRLGRSQCWGAFLWRLFLGAKKHGERLTAEDMENAWCLGDENAVELPGRGPVGKILRYLLKQIDRAGPGAEDEYGDPIAEYFIDVAMLLDYWTGCQELGRSLDDPQVRWPRNLLEAHDTVMELWCQREQWQQEQTLAALFRVRQRQLARYIFEADGLKIVPAYSQRELQKEADELHHCVWTYAESHAKGNTAIFFIRRTVEPQKPYYTLELDEKTLTVRQNRGLRNCGKTVEIQAFEDLWIAWVRAGAQRDQRGRPLLPGKKPSRRRGIA